MQHTRCRYVSAEARAPSHFVDAIGTQRSRADEIEDYGKLKLYAKRSVIGGDVLYLPALNFLFLLGLIEYHPKTDAVEYVGPNEAV